jgi:hypothetical protein
MLTLAALSLAATVVPAQELPPQFVIAVNLTCRADAGTGPDSIVSDGFATTLSDRVSAGQMTGWGWLSAASTGIFTHNMYFVGGSLDTLRAARSRADSLLRQQHSDATGRFRALCPRREESIWQRVTASPADAKTGDPSAAGLIIHYDCHKKNEPRADSLIINVFAPAFNRHLKSGELTWWGWYKRAESGQYRRMLSFDAASVETIQKLLPQIQAEYPAEWGMLESACEFQRDQYWNIRIPKH